MSSEQSSAPPAAGKSPLNTPPPFAEAPPVGTAPAPTATPPTATSAAKKKKKKKNSASISIASPASLELESAEPSPVGTPTIAKSQDDVEAEIQKIAAVPEIVAPVLEPLAAPVIDFSASPPTSMAPLEESVNEDAPLLPADELQPDFGAHSSPTDAVHIPSPGVPAAMPPHASSLFADEAEGSAFEFSTDAANEWEVEDPAAPQHAAFYEASHLQAKSPDAVAQPEQPPFVDNDVEGAAFESTATLDAAMDTAGAVHEEDMYLHQAGERCATNHPSSLFADDHRDFDLDMGHDATPEPAAAPASKSLQSNDVVVSSHHEAASLFDDEAEAIAFDMPTGIEALEGANDDSVSEYLPKPMSHAASALFADEAENVAFDIGMADVEPQVEQQVEHEDEVQAETAPVKETVPSQQEAPAQAAPPLTAQALFADDESGDAFDIPIHGDSVSGSAPPSATVQPSSTLAPSAPMNAAALFSDDTDAFDIGVPDASPVAVAPSPPAAAFNVAEEKTAMSLFTSTSSDFLVDTSFDDTIDFGRDDMRPISPPILSHTSPVSAAPPAASVPDIEVPDGWYDDAGTFNWYTAEEKEAVRQSMLGDSSYGGTPQQSENDRRRTPEPLQDPYAPASLPADPYAPPAPNPYAPPAPAAAPVTQPNPYAPVALPTQPNPYAPAVQQSYSAYQQAPAVVAPATGLYTPGFQTATSFAATAPVAEPYSSPYAPAAPAVGYAAQPYGTVPAPYDPYAPAATGYAAPATFNAGPSKAPTSPKAEPPKRMKATAYDAPFLNRASKSRQSSLSHPVPAAPFVVPEDAPPLPVAPPAPPPGPPKTATLDSLPTLGSMGASPVVPLPRAQSAAPDPYTPTSAYDPAPLPAQPYSVIGYGQVAEPYAPQRSMSPPVKPPQRPATASATHPPKPTSFDPPLRQTTSRPPSRHASRPDFSSPPMSAGALPPVPTVPKEFAFSGPPKIASANHSPAYASFSPPPPPPKNMAFSPPPPKHMTFSPPPPKSLSPPPANMTSPPPIPPKVLSPPPPQATIPPPKAMGPPKPMSPPRRSPPKVASPPQVPSPPPPARAASPGFVPPPKTATPPPRTGSPRRAPSHGAPPRVSSPLRQESVSGMSLAQAAVSMDAPRKAMGLHEEADPEGGDWNEEPTETPASGGYGSTPYTPAGYEPAPYVPAPAQSSGYEAAPYVPDTPKESSGYEPAPYVPETPKEPSGYEPAPYVPEVPKEASSGYEPAPYVPAPTEGYEPTPYAPYSPPKATPASPTKATRAPLSQPEYNPYASAPAQPAPNAYAPPPASQHPPKPEYNPYATSSPRKASQAPPAEYNPYAPVSPRKAAHAPPPVETNPYSPRQSADYGRTSGDYSRESGEYSRKSGDYTRPSFDAARPSFDATNAYLHERKSSAAGGYQPFAAPESNPYAPAQNEYNPYASPPTNNATLHQGRQPSLGGSSTSPYAPMNVTLPGYQGDRYSPTNMHTAAQRTASPPQEFGMSPNNNYFQNMHLDATYVPQQILEQRPVAEDPLGRCTPAARNVPFAKFGFGGFLITSFPGTSNDSAETPTYGYGSYRGLLSLRPVSEVVEASALSTTETPFPGPLIFDGAAKGPAGDKKRREVVLAYLSARADEIERGLPYLKSSASRARREEEAKLVIVRILAAFVEGDGRVFGNPTAEEAVRTALQPLATNATVAPTMNGLGVGSVPLGGRASASQMAELSAMAMRGEKREAAQFAAQAGLWSHALVISSSVDPELWREMVTRFTVAELAENQSTSGLKAAYTVYAGLTPANIDDLFKASHITGDPSADQWREVVAAVLFNGKPTDLVCLDDLGARFKKAGLLSVSHLCTLLSPNSPFSDLSPGPGERPVLLVENELDEDSLIFAEIAEYARTLVPTPKGVEGPFPAMSQLLPYKLQRAWRAAELGNNDQARAYCETIGAASEVPDKGKTRTLAPHLAAALEDLLERLSGEPSVAPTKGLRTSGVRKAKSSATLGSWIEGRLTKFIAGEEDGVGAKPAGLTVKKDETVGPFSHFSTISPSPAPSQSVSRAVSSVDMNGPPSTGSMEPPTPYGPASAGYGGGYHPWGGDDDDENEAETPHASALTTVPTVNVEAQGGFINPMGNLNFGSPSPAADYNPPARTAANDVPAFDDEDDLGFGNAGLSRGRTPKVPDEPPADPYKPATPKPEEKKVEEKKEDKPATPAKGSWLGGWWGKKKEAAPGEPGAPGKAIRAHMGEEMSMVYDPELKRYVMKGQKLPPATAAAAPPPPRAQTASPGSAARPPPAARANTTTPSQPPLPAMPSGLSGMSASSSAGLPSRPASGAPVPPRGPPGVSAPPGATTGGPPRTASSGSGISGLPGATSLDDLLSRPASGRPVSAAKKKRAANKYVDVFQQ